MLFEKNLAARIEVLHLPLFDHEASPFALRMIEVAKIALIIMNYKYTGTLQYGNFKKDS